MRARVALLIGLSCRPDSLVRIERGSVFCAKNPLRESRAKILSLLSRDASADLATIHPELPARVQTYSALEVFCARYRRAYAVYRAVLRERPPYLIKALLALADMAFLRHEISEDPLEELVQELSGSPAALATAEDFCAMVSLTVAEAVEERPLADLEFEFPISFGLNPKTLQDVLPMASIRFRAHELMKQVTALGYHLVRERVGRKDVFKLVEPKPGVERYFRIAHITAHMAKLARQPVASSETDGSMTEIARPMGEALTSTAVSMRALAEVLIKRLGKDIYHLETEPFPRYVLTVPLMPFLADGRHYDDYAQSWATASDFILPYTSLLQIPVAKELTLGELMNVHRAIRIFAALQTSMLRVTFGAYHEAALNSVLPVFTRERLTDMFRWTAPTLSAAGLDAAIDALCWSAQDGFLDLQYRPLLRAEQTYLLLPRVAASSSIARNTLTGVQRRVADAGTKFSNIVGEELKQRFAHVAVERPLRAGRRDVGDVDVTVLLDHRLYLFECKYSVLGANPHEFAELFEAVQHAGDQLRKTLGFLAEHPNPRGLLRSWFPNATEDELAVEHFRPCTLTATRVLSGMTSEEFPVRSWFSLRRLVHSGDIDVTGLVDGAVRGLRAKLWHGDSCGGVDLDDFLRPDGRSAAVRELYICPFTEIEFYHGDTIVARESVLAAFPTTLTEWREDLEKLGLAVEEFVEAADTVVMTEEFWTELGKRTPGQGPGP